MDWKVARAEEWKLIGTRGELDLRVVIEGNLILTEGRFFGGKFVFSVMLVDKRVLVLEKNGADEGARTA